MGYSSRFASGVAFLAFVLAAPAAVLAQGAAAIEGFGGLSLSAPQSQSPSLGGTVTFSVVPGVQIVAEAGRIGNVLPSMSSALYSLARTDLRASALYGGGGVRFVLAPSAAVTPYVEASAGIARLDVRSGRLGPVANAVTSLALGLIGPTTPIGTAGGGLMVHGGPILFDAGYRYTELFANDIMRTVLGLGQPLRTHQVRFGVGVRF